MGSSSFEPPEQRLARLQAIILHSLDSGCVSQQEPTTLTRKNKENWPRAHVHKTLRVLFHEDADAARQKCPNF